MNITQQNDIWHLRKQLNGNRKLVSLKTKSKTTATSRANRFLTTLEDTGSWDKAVAELHGKKVLKKGESPTFDQMKVLYEAFQASTAKPIRENTQTNYLNALKRLMSWADAETVADIDLDNLTNDSNTSENIKIAKSIFKPACLKFYKKQGTELENPFADFEAHSSKPTPYEPLDPKQAKSIWNDAVKHEEPLKGLIVLLAMGVGLRISEIDKARVSWITYTKEGANFKVQKEDDYLPKNRCSRTIPISIDLADTLLKLRSNASPNDADPYLVPGAGRGKYRHGRAYRGLVDWLGKRGVVDKRPLHSLRKYFGSIVFTNLGIESAASYLGHADISLTYSTYASLTKKATVDMGSIING